MRSAVKIGMMAKLAEMMPSHNGGRPSSMVRYETLTRTTSTATWVTTMCAKSGASSVQSMSRRPARRSSSVIDCFEGPVRQRGSHPCLLAGGQPAKPVECTSGMPQARGLSLQQVAGMLGGGNGAGPCGFERARERECRPAVCPRPHQAVGKRQAFAPDVIDHRMVRRCTGVDASEARLGEQRLGGLQHELHTG